MTNDAGKLPTEIKQALIDTLANLYATQAQAEELLEDMDFPSQTRPRWDASREVVAFWRQVVRALELGAVPTEGVPQLVETALRRWPGNHDLQKIREFLRTQQHEQTGAGRNADTRYRTIEFVGSEAYPEFLQLVRELVDHEAVQLYANHQQAAFQVAEMPADRLQQLQDRAARIAPGVEVLYGEHDFRPALYTRLRFQGPDQQLYEIPYVPNTTLPSELVPTIWAEYRPEVSRDANGQLRRAVVDYRDENGEAQRLDPDVPLFNQGIRDGGQLEVSAESTAGVDSLLRLEAIAQAREDIADFADAHEEFTLVHMDDDRLPLRFEVELHVPGFAPPEDLEAWPLEPRPIDRHELMIALPAEFPIQAPRVLWLSEVFHPNIARDEEFGKGSVCLGPLMTDYTPDLSLYVLCQTLIDMARYRNYEILPHDYQMALDYDSLVRDMLERGGYLDRAAAAWAFSFEGQERIKEIGGTTWLARAGLTVRADRSRSLTVHRVEASPDEY
ncbi:effector-associated domain EAD1-containing protein [Streptomyces endophyticus]|uniref:Ubiquitin-conjugating enzyme E2 n=1 Tax=Streptomyces endophyticus TaxID=714166 RepID=A0ABU6FG95_9ACTN|nr:effector-associated domain EAD1-containing protein [Streptomyces endophyticus]MEB8343004.1 ubiquitin-conjugating enzyme E2 [Streptomyces endophyticus]